MSDNPWTRTLDIKLIATRIRLDNQFRGCNCIAAFHAWNSLAKEHMPASMDGAMCQSKWDELLAGAMVTFNNGEQDVENRRLLIDEEDFNPYLETFLKFFCPYDKWTIHYC